MQTHELIAIADQKLSVKNEFLALIKDNRLEEAKKLFKKYFNEKYLSIIDECHQKNIQIITILDKDYPDLLRQIPDSPLVLYALGNTALLASKQTIGIVGTRNCSDYGAITAFNLARELAIQGVVIVSGLALGVDAEAHKGALSAGKTIAVLGNGVDKAYPATNRNIYREIQQNNSLVISEYPPGKEATPYTFPERNRIIAGLSRGVVVVESKEKGGSLITADLAVNYNREVFVVPGRITDENSRGANLLIQSGAKLIVCVEDIFTELNWIAGKTQTKNYVPEKEEKEIYKQLSLEPISIEEILGKVEKNIIEVSAIISKLEMKKVVKQLPGKRYILT